jgi:hypothetical protein
MYFDMTPQLFIKKIRGLIRHNYNIDHIRTPFGEPFNKDNHWVRALQEYDDGMRDYKESSLYMFHQNFQPKTIFDVMELREDELTSLASRYPLGNYPWCRWVQPLSVERWKQSRHCGPTVDSIIKNEWDLFIELYQNIQSEGLNIAKYGHPIGLSFIAEDNDDYYFVLGGNHRAAIAAHLGQKSLPVRLFARDYIDKQVVYFKEIDLLDNEDVDISKKLFKELVSERFVKYKHA